MDEVKLGRIAMAYQTLFYREDGVTLKPEAEIVLVDILVKHGRFTRTTSAVEGLEALQRNEGKRELAEHIFGMMRLDVWALFDMAQRERTVTDAMSEV